jgi:hypothetical protein
VSNKLFFGGFFTPPLAFHPGDFREGAFGLLFSPRWGLFFFAPAAVLAVICWPGYLRRHPREGAMLGGLLLLSFLLFANWGGWYGMAFGPRYLVPVLPMLFVPLVAAGGLFEAPSPGRALALALVLFSAAINAAGVFRYDRYWCNHPLVAWVQASYQRFP